MASVAENRSRSHFSIRPIFNSAPTNWKKVAGRGRTETLASRTAQKNPPGGVSVAPRPCPRSPVECKVGKRSARAGRRVGRGRGGFLFVAAARIKVRFFYRRRIPHQPRRIFKHSLFYPFSEWVNCDAAGTRGGRGRRCAAEPRGRTFLKSGWKCLYVRSRVGLLIYYFRFVLPCSAAADRPRGRGGSGVGTHTK